MGWWSTHHHGNLGLPVVWCASVGKLGNQSETIQRREQRNSSLRKDTELFNWFNCCGTPPHFRSMWDPCSNSTGNYFKDMLNLEPQSRRFYDGIRWPRHYNLTHQGRGIWKPCRTGSVGESQLSPTWDRSIDRWSSQQHPAIPFIVKWWPRVMLGLALYACIIMYHMWTSESATWMWFKQFSLPFLFPSCCVPTSWVTNCQNCSMYPWPHDVHNTV